MRIDTLQSTVSKILLFSNIIIKILFYNFKIDFYIHQYIIHKPDELKKRVKIYFLTDNENEPMTLQIFENVWTVQI